VASAFEFVTTGTPDEARDLVAGICGSEGYTASVTPNGSLLVSRGSAALTFWFGAMAASKFHLRFDLQFSTNEQQHAVVKLNRSLVGGMLKGGAIGAALTASKFQELASAVEIALSTQGRLISTSAL